MLMKLVQQLFSLFKLIPFLTYWLLCVYYTFYTSTIRDLLMTFTFMKRFSLSRTKVDSQTEKIPSAIEEPYERCIEEEAPRRASTQIFCRLYA